MVVKLSRMERKARVRAKAALMAAGRQTAT